MHKKNVCSTNLMSLVEMLTSDSHEIWKIFEMKHNNNKKILWNKSQQLYDGI